MQRKIWVNDVTTVHPFDVHLKFLWLTEFTAAKIAERFSPLRIRTATVSAMHFQIVQSEEELLAELALVGAFPVVLLDGVLHDVVFSDEGAAADLIDRYKVRKNIIIK